MEPIKINGLYSEEVKEILELNEVISSNFSNWREVNRMLRIKKLFEEKLEVEFESIYFDTIHDYMNEKNWVWYFSESDEHVPSIVEMKKFVKTNFLNSAIHHFLCYGNRTYISSSGGFVFVSQIRTIEDPCFPSDISISVMFDIGSHNKSFNED